MGVYEGFVHSESRDILEKCDFCDPVTMVIKSLLFAEGLV